MWIIRRTRAYNWSCLCIFYITVNMYIHTYKHRPSYIKKPNGSLCIIVTILSIPFINRLFTFSYKSSSTSVQVFWGIPFYIETISWLLSKFERRADLQCETNDDRKLRSIQQMLNRTSNVSYIWLVFVPFHFRCFVFIFFSILNFISFLTWQNEWLFVVFIFLFILNIASDKCLRIIFINV